MSVGLDGKWARIPVPGTISECGQQCKAIGLHSHHPRGAGCGCSSSPGCDAVFLAGVDTCRWVLKMQMMSPSTATAMSILGFCFSSGLGLVL